MRAGSWQFPGSTLIRLCPVWGQEGLRQTCNLVIANYIFKAFCCCSLLRPPAPLSWLPWVVTSSCLLPLPSTVLAIPPPPSTGQQQQRWPRDRTTERGGKPASCPLPLPLPPSCPGASVTSARFLPGCPEGHSRLNSPASASWSMFSEQPLHLLAARGPALPRCLRDLPSPPAAAAMGASLKGESGGK